MPEVDFSTTNSTRIVPHNTVVKYKCNLYYEAEGETVRSCFKGMIIPSFRTNPLKCASKLLYLNDLVFTVIEKIFVVLTIGFNFAALKKFTSLLGKQLLNRLRIFRS